MGREKYVRSLVVFRCSNFSLLWTGNGRDSSGCQGTWKTGRRGEDTCLPLGLWIKRVW